MLRLFAPTGDAGVLWAAWLLLVAGSLTAPAQTAAKVSFSRDVAPILTQKCMQCHGKEPLMAHLDLRTREAVPSRVGSTGRRLFRAKLGAKQSLPAFAPDSRSLRLPMGGSLNSAGDRSRQGLDRQRSPVGRNGFTLVASPSGGRPGAQIHRETTGVLGLSESGEAGLAVGQRRRPLRTRSTPSCWPSSKEKPATEPPRRQDHAAAPRHDRSDRPAAHPEEMQAFSGRRLARRVRESGRPAARLAALRRALGRATGWTWPATPTATASRADETRPNIWRYRDYVINASTTTSPTTAS